MNLKYDFCLPANHRTNKSHPRLPLTRPQTAPKYSKPCGVFKNVCFHYCKASKLNYDICLASNHPNNKARPQIAPKPAPNYSKSYGF